VIPQAPAQQNRTLLEELQRFGRSFSLEKIQEAIVKHDQELEQLRAAAAPVPPPPDRPSPLERFPYTLRSEQLEQLLHLLARIHHDRDLGLFRLEISGVTMARLAV
jgi:hypothetical protein